MLLDFTALDVICHDIVQDYNVSDAKFSIFKDMLFLTGCRPQEVLYAHLWSVAPNGSLFLQPLKNNNPREFLPAELNQDFYDSVINNDFLFFGGELRSYNRHWNRLQGVPLMSLDNSFITWRLFRHRYIKKLSIDGFTVPQIMGWTGHKVPAIVTGYINSAIYAL